MHPINSLIAVSPVLCCRYHRCGDGDFAMQRRIISDKIVTRNFVQTVRICLLLEIYRSQNGLIYSCQFLWNPPWYQRLHFRRIFHALSNNRDLNHCTQQIVHRENIRRIFTSILTLILYGSVLKLNYSAKKNYSVLFWIQFDTLRIVFWYIFFTYV